MSKCPPGVWCLTPMFGAVLTVLTIIVILAIGFYILQGPKSVVHVHKEYREPSQIPLPPTIVSGDDRYTRAPEPLRFWQSPPDLRGALLPPGAVAINMNPRGVPKSFQQYGIIKSEDKLLPLYGRQTGYRSDRFNYYTRTDTYNPVQLPIRYERKDCMDTIGCNELFGGETVKVKGIDKDGKVEIYKFDGPSYIPGIV